MKYKNLAEVWANPINRNLLVIFATALGFAVALVTSAIILIGQL